MEQLGINPTYLITQIINFAILVIVLAKFVYKPILEMLEKRRQKIEEGLALTDKLIKEKAELEEKGQRIIDQAQKEARVIIEKSKDQGKKVEQEIIKEARVEAEGIIEHGRRDVDLRRKEMENKLVKETVDITTALVEKIIGDVLDSKKQEMLLKKRINQFLKQKKFH